MRKLLFAAVIAVMGAFVFVAGTPAQAVTASTFSEIGKAAPQSNITKTHCCRYRHYYRYRYYRPRYYYRRYYYRRHYWRRCYRHYRHYHCYYY